MEIIISDISKMKNATVFNKELLVSYSQNYAKNTYVGMRLL